MSTRFWFRQNSVRETPPRHTDVMPSPKFVVMKGERDPRRRISSAVGRPRRPALLVYWVDNLIGAITMGARIALHRRWTRLAVHPRAHRSDVQRWSRQSRRRMFRGWRRTRPEEEAQATQDEGLVEMATLQNGEIAERESREPQWLGRQVSPLEALRIGPRIA